MLSFHFIVLALPVFYLFSDAEFSLGEGLVELVVLLLELDVLYFVGLDELLLGSLKVLILFDLDCAISLELRL